MPLSSRLRQAVLTGTVVDLLWSHEPSRSVQSPAAKKDRLCGEALLQCILRLG